MNNNSPSFWCSKEVLTKFPELYNEIAQPALKTQSSEEYTEIMATWNVQEMIASKAAASFSCRKPAAMIGVELYNVTQNRIMKTDYIDACDVMTLQAVISSDKKFVKNGDMVETRTHFIWIEPDGSVKTADRIILNKINLMNVVEEILVKAPRARDKKRTIVLYGRSPVAPEVEDYIYENNKNIDNKVKAMLPVKGTVRFDSNYSIEEILFTGEHEPKLNMILSSGQTPPKYKKDFSKAIKIVDKQNVCFEFEDDWGDEIDVSCFTISTIVDVNFNFTVRAKYFGMDVYITIVVTSIDDNSLIKDVSSAATTIIEQVSIRWGCLGKDTNILMADGVEMPISDIRIGEMVLTPRGKDIVDNIYTGKEDTMISIKTASSKNLLATHTHPFVTKRGIITAENLNGADILITLNGEEPITELFEYSYHNLVYSLRLSSHNQFFAEGILTGDFMLQNTMLQSNKAPTWSDKAKLMQSQIKEFACQLRKQQG